MQVLIVDDLLADRMLLKSILSRAGFSTLLAENGLEALEVIEEHPDIDVLITDIDMPRMDGLTLLENLRGYSFVKLVTSAHGRDTAKARSEALGGAFLEKPLSGSKLTELLRGLLPSF